ncbi:MAG: hypothetical protein OEO19_11020 [Gammaproteobacteria bacterium]|nr:hypothetical protein [Gammaproteobacteria bacterium]MDH3449069.1 hypothetical protein [Gammaproteobacteria bacterium]
MNTIGSHPGAILFRLSTMIILIAILMVVFFSYIEDTERALERASIAQTKRIIDSSLAVVFSSYAVSGRLDDLNDLAGGNPFVFLREFGLLPPGYVGAIDRDPAADLAPGWYYLRHRRQVFYKSGFSDADSYYAVVLNYQDVNQSGFFESSIDRFRNLQFVAERR